MSDSDLQRLLAQPAVSPWRITWARRVESTRVQSVIVFLILFNALILGLETDTALRDRFGFWLLLADRFCLVAFVVELGLKLIVYRSLFWRSGWNWFDAFVVGVTLVPGAGPWSVLRSLRVLRVLRLLTVLPQLRKVVAAFLHAIPGLTGVMAIMAIFFYTAGVLATTLFSATQHGRASVRARV